MPDDDGTVDTDNLVTVSRYFDNSAARYRSILRALPNLKDPVAFGNFDGAGVLDRFATEMTREFMKVYGPAADAFAAACDAMYSVLGQIGPGVREMARTFQRADDAAADASQGLLNNFTAQPPASGGEAPPASHDGAGGAGRH